MRSMMASCEGVETKRVLKTMGWLDLRGLGGACPIANISSSQPPFALTPNTCTPITKQATKSQLVRSIHNNGEGNLSEGHHLIASLLEPSA